MAFKPIEILINAKDNASSVFSSLQAKIASVGVAVAGYFGVKSFAGIIEGAAAFEQAMSRVKAATGASAEELAALKKSAEDAGAATKYTSEEAAGALENLAKAGLSASDSIEALPAVLALAQAGDVGLAESAEYVTKAVMGMGLAFTDAGRVADVLALGANATNTSVSGLAEALSYAAPVAQSVGVSLEGTVAMMGKLADAGIDASRSGTAMANMLAQFSDPASAFKRALADAGIVTNDFEQALHQLAAAGPKGEKAIQAIGLNAGPALRSLLNQGMGALDELKAKLEGAAGSAAEAAKVMGDNLKGSMNGLSSAWDTVKNTLGTPVLPVVKDAVDQLAASLRGAVSDGTIQRFGDTLATALKAAIQWATNFVGAIDFDALLVKLRGFADEFSATLDKVGEYARNAGNIVQTAWGVMTAGSNAVLAAIYKIGEAFAGVASNIQSGLALIMDGFAKITFGDVSKAFKTAADEIRKSAEATWTVSEAFAQKAGAAFDAAADGARLAQDGFKGLVGAMGEADAQAAATSAALAAVAQELQKTAEATAAAAEAARKKAESDAAAKQAATDHAAAVAQLRSEYAELVQAGNLQGAAEKLQEINKALRDTPQASKDAAAAATAAAKEISDAFGRMGIVTKEALADAAATSLRDYELIKNSGQATADGLSKAFKKAAEDAIAANNGVASSWVKSEASARGYTVSVDAAGKATLQAAGATDKAAASHDRAAASVDRHATALERLNAEKEREIAAQEKSNQLKERAEELERKRLGVDKEGFSTDKNGQRQQQFAWTRASIVEYLEQSGLSQELAERLSKDFVDGNGNVNYAASAAQTKWGGKYSTLAGALGKMAEYYKYNDSGKQQASEMEAFERNKNAPAPAPLPPAQQQTGGGSGVQTAAPAGAITININGINDPVKLARLIEPELARLTKLAR